jgi:hypothetical protein
MFGRGRKRAIQNVRATYCRIRRSPNFGVGVFAIRHIPEGIDPFAGPRRQRWYEAHMKDFADLEPEVKAMLDDFYVIQEDGGVWINADGLNGLHIRWFLNHSNEPNMNAVDGGLSFVTKRPIMKGEELLVDYGTYDPKWKDGPPSR